jgi:hypothetical protein
VLPDVKTAPVDFGRFVPRVGVALPDALVTYLEVHARRALRAQSPEEFKRARLALAEVVRVTQRALEAVNVARAAYNAARPAKAAKGKP